MDDQSENRTIGSYGQIGTTGLRQYGGLIDDEFAAFLKGNKAAKFYKEMSRNNWAAHVAMLAIRKMIQSLQWAVTPTDETLAEAVTVADHIETCRTDMADSWDTTLVNIASMCIYGWSWQEVLYKQRRGRTGIPETDSAYDDGRWGWRRWAPRSQESLHKWEIDDDGDVTGMWQLDVSSGKPPLMIPIERSALFALDAENGNPEGRSLLRGGAISYYFARQVREYEGIGIERRLAGIPVAHAPDEWFMADAPQHQKDALADVSKMTQYIRQNKQQGVVLPHIVDEDNGQILQKVTLSLLSSGDSSRDLAAISSIITRYDREIVGSILMDFLLLGHESVGSKALAVSKIDLWLAAVEAIAKMIADVVNTHVIPKLVALNGWDPALSPKLTYGAIDTADTTETAALLGSLVDAGLIQPDSTLYAFVRERFNLPEPDDDADISDAPPTGAQDGQ